MDDLVDQKLNIRLVQAVEKYSIIYNTAIKGFNRKRNIRAREAAWKTIGEELKCDESKLKIKWQTFRSYLNRIEREKRKGKHVQKYYLHDHIQFLLPYLKSSQNKTYNKEETGVNEYDSEDMNESVEEYEIVDEVDDADQDTKNFEYHDFSPENEIVTNELIAGAPSPRPSPKRYSKAVRNRAVSTSKHSTPLSMAAQTASSSIGDAEPEQLANSEIAKRHFLFSLLPDLDEMSNAQMRHFKYNVSRLIDEILKEK
ncbi:uncharacterized protein LOC105664860 isoform X1 [Ceratitis capitata]|uniref:uncharacterized protein LOC105664860 isoform X1 n=1 Tax=Ceratitis capitata TaxID=7213 RepID=UPI00061891A2|nr:uncharacterized protein LOC105664860 isoform X1 [Ceratitis capitata]